MIRHIYTLKKELRNKTLYIWGTGKRAVWAFSYLACRGLSVAGFITETKKYQGGTFMNCPVLPREDAGKLRDAVILFDRDIQEWEVKGVRKEAECYYLEDAFELNEELFRESFYIYGTGRSAWDFVKILSSAGLSPKGFLVTRKGDTDAILGFPVLVFADAQLAGTDAIFVGVQDERQMREIMDGITRSGFAGNIYIDELVRHENIWSVDPFPMLDHAAKTGKRVLLCCEDEQTGALLRGILEQYHIPLAREVCLDGDADRGLNDIYDLADEDPDKCVLLIHAYSDEQRLRIVEAANALGFSAGKRNYAAIHMACYNRRAISGQMEYEHDELIPFNASVDYTPFGGLPGWSVYGDKENAATRIMILGGSTSSDRFYSENWVSKFYKKLSAAGIRAVVYNGAIEMGDSFEELLRMCRGIRYLKPDIVISLSGVNDLKRGYGKFELFQKESPFSYWRRFHYYMKIVAESEGAVYEPFLQPMNCCMPDAGLEDGMFFYWAGGTPNDIFLNESSSDDFYHNLISLFFHKEGMFIDFCHYSEEANEILADSIFQTIREHCK